MSKFVSKAVHRVTTYGGVDLKEDGRPGPNCSRVEMALQFNAAVSVAIVLQNGAFTEIDCD
jgi:hypothetical protein